jgi:hypothetical protein
VLARVEALKEMGAGILPADGCEVGAHTRSKSERLTCLQ